MKGLDQAVVGEYRQHLPLGGDALLEFMEWVGYVVMIVCFGMRDVDLGKTTRISM